MTPQQRPRDGSAVRVDEPGSGLACFAMWAAFIVPTVIQFFGLWK